ncbi:MAG TPA: NHL repeat-containing protein [Bacteroidia bacterium]|nr:NHL repeat-containing protein [Bacteroidia bacterium]
MKKVTIAFLIFFISSLLSYGQIINTIAGDSTAGYNGDGISSNFAKLNQPSSVATDASGNIYIADFSNNRIRKVNSSGTITTIAGNGTAGYKGDGGPAVSAEIDEPYSITIDKSGNLFIADYYYNIIRKVNTSGIISTVAGNGTRGYSGDGSPATSAQLYWPSGIAIDKSGNIFIADCFNSRIRKVDASTGIITTVAGNGTRGFSGDGGLATAATLNKSNYVIVDDSDNIFIADTWNNRVRKVNNKTGIITTIIGSVCGFSGDGGLASAAKLYYPEALAFDQSGNLYIADSYNKRIRMVNTSGIINTVAGNGSAGYAGDGGKATLAQLRNPVGVTTDASANIYIVDWHNNSIRKVTPSFGTNQSNSSNAEDIKVIPNPFVTTTTISFTENAQHYLELDDMAGTKLRTMECSGTQYEFNSKGLPKGIYLLKVFNSQMIYESSVKLDIQ